MDYGSPRYRKARSAKRTRDDALAKQQKASLAGLMLRGFEWNPTKTLRIKERVDAESGLVAKWAAVGRPYDLGTEHAFAEYAGEVFRLGLKTVSAFTNATSGDAFDAIGPPADHVRGVLHNWYIENISGNSKLIHVDRKSVV